MSHSLHTGAPVSAEQKALLARLIRQGRVTIDQLSEANAELMTRAELARWLDLNVFGTAADEQTLSQVETLFADAPAEAKTGGRAS